MRSVRADLILNTSPIHAEGPWWDTGDRRLWWVDLLGMKIHRSDPLTSMDMEWSVPEHVGAVVARSSGGAVALLRSGFAAVTERGECSWLSKVEASDPTTRLNDGKCDPGGRLVGGTLSYQKVPGAGSLYRLGPDLGVTRLLSGLTLSNGLAWSGDGRVLYLVDSATRTITSYDYEREPLRRLEERTVGPGVPDGMTIDADGCLWVALYGAGIVQRYTPSGGIDTRVTLPVTGITSCVFGGAELDVLYITTSSYSLSEAERPLQPGAGGIFACVPGAVGRAERRFQG